jgi:hypothetical protein
VTAQIREGTNILWAGDRGAYYKGLALWLVPVQNCIRKFNNGHNNRYDQHMFSATNARFVCVFMFLRSGLGLNLRGTLAHVYIQALVS